MAEAISILQQHPKTTLDAVLSAILIPFACFSTQKAYFQLVEESLFIIEMIGYDQPYMDSGPTQKAFSMAAQNGVTIEATIPEGIETYLDTLQSRQNVKVTRHPSHMINGFMVIDGNHTAIWDSTRRTLNPFERNKGVHWRVLRYFGTELADEVSAYFVRLNRELKGNLG